MTGLRLDGLGVDVDRTPIVRDLTVDCPPGRFVGLLGPNGSGKSTVLKTVYHALRPRAGTVLLDGLDLHRDLGPRAAARQVSALTQEHSGDIHLSVGDVVTTGRLLHQNTWSRTSTLDREIVAEALRTVGMTEKTHRSFASLSGGEKQRVLLARALAAQPRLLVLDEPTNHLDIGSRLDLLELIRSLGITVLAALHDLDLAAAFCDLVHVLADGKVVAAGPPAEVLTPGLLRQVFRVHAHRGLHPVTGRPHFAFSSLTSEAPSLPGAPPPADGCSPLLAEPHQRVQDPFPAVKGTS
ncbi:ABC transporter ATP-binding protein [Frankia sp. AgB1.9]|uniref:ABC transporter ATP-binding protein n=1 Tax=unclassified Frankia TaxID=2632575 RepID=UPI001934A26F|nr:MULTISPECIES: ABC transporter ATP-binding protein [unclassified Frankia]MBL7493703.1 ABC transporter ATP-binding protein [Frankia sp. AgW1.1]MBL7553011.1 ABC transporter ATP-binding protein [Frankia sp. AgB1.9]MBL7621597.1 ABC transporter ATP-binding protein [Frankia sp. AgB1.8]